MRTMLRWFLNLTGYPIAPDTAARYGLVMHPYNGKWVSAPKAG